MKDEVVVTGLGVISALGNHVSAHIQAFHKNQCGIKRNHLLSSKFPLGAVSLSNEELIEILGLSSTSKYSRTFLLAYYAVLEAVSTANVSENDIKKAILISGSSVGGMDTGEQFYRKLKQENIYDSEALHVHDVGQAVSDISKRLGIKGYCSTISTACSSAANAILMGAQYIRSGRASIAIVGGADALCQFTIAGFHSLMILSDEQNQPFDLNRKGLNLGEGAGFLVLESYSAAKKRNARPLAKISGFANTCDAFHQTASSPDGQGAFLAMSQALKMAGNPDISYINTHGTATVNNDLSESTALIRVFESNVPAFSSTKAMIGHTLAASGGIESVFSVLSIQEQLLLPNLFWENPIVEIGLKPIVQATHAPVHAVLSNSFGFGGNNTSLIFEAM